MSMATIVITQEALAVAWHAAWEWQYDQCMHGVYSGGAQAGQPYKMCELMAARIVETVDGVRDDRADKIAIMLAGSIDMATPGSLVAQIWAVLYPGDGTAPSPVAGEYR